MKSPPLAVCLTSYKRGYVIERSIESILAQDFGDFELVISDDASGDETADICRKYERLDSRVRFICQPRNVGMPANLHTAAFATTAPLIANLHDGDTFHRSLLSKWMTALEEHPDAAFAFCQVVHLDESGQPTVTRAPALPKLIAEKELVRFMLSPDTLLNSPVWGTVMARRSAYSSVGWFEPRYSFFADVAMWMRLNLRYPVAYVQEPLIHLKSVEPGRPWEVTNWALSQVTFDIYQEAMDGLFAGDPVKIAQERKRLRSVRDRVWIHSLGSCIKRDRQRQIEEAAAIFAAEDSLTLRGAAIFASTYQKARNRFPSLYNLVSKLGKHLERPSR